MEKHREHHSFSTLDHASPARAARKGRCILDEFIIVEIIWNCLYRCRILF